MKDKSHILKQDQIQNKIYSFRGIQVMIDRDLAKMYQVETRVLNQAVKRNQERFPDTFMFQLSESEFANWKSQIVMSKEDNMGLRRPPYVFTEQGIAMLSSVLRSQTAVKVSIAIINAFIEMRRFISSNATIFQRIKNLELKQLEADNNFEKIFSVLENHHSLPQQGVFFDGQIYDAYNFVSEIVKSAKHSIQIIDNYIDDSVITLLSKKNKNVTCTIYSHSISKQLLLDIKKFNQQYGKLTALPFKKSHDRFIIIDNESIYHFGASLKDLGKKWFAFSKIEKDSVTIINEIKKLN
jgi:hypothetical protein